MNRIDRHSCLQTLLSLRCFVGLSQVGNPDLYLVSAGMATASLSLLAVLVAGALLALLADQAAGQTFSYSRGWKSGKRAGAQPAPVGPPPPGARTGDDVLAEDMPLFRYFLEGRGEHRVSTGESG